MSEDWQPGDLALCIKSTENGTIKSGYVGVVVRVEVAEDWYRDGGQTGLYFQDRRGVYGDGGFNACRFRKIKKHTPDAEDAETIRLLKGEKVKA